VSGPVSAVLSAQGVFLDLAGTLEAKFVELGGFEPPTLFDCQAQV
jgi:hypothetical protein